MKYYCSKYIKPLKYMQIILLQYICYNIDHCQPCWRRVSVTKGMRRLLSFYGHFQQYLLFHIRCLVSSTRHCVPCLSTVQFFDRLLMSQTLFYSPQLSSTLHVWPEVRPLSYHRRYSHLLRICSTCMFTGTILNIVVIHTTCLTWVLVRSQVTGPELQEFCQTLYPP